MELDQITDENGLITRSFQIRATDTAKREFTGIGVPYGEIYDTGWGYREAFDPGSIAADGSKVWYRHREVIGKLMSTRETPAGFEITGKISDTTQGRDAWTLLADGAVDHLSIGFRPIEYRVETDAEGRETIIHTKVRASEFSLVPNPAYEGAKILSHRHATPNPKGTTAMPDADVLTRSDLEPLADGLEVLKRSVAALGTGPAAPAVPQFRSMGDFVKAVANGDADAAEFHRAYTGGTTADTVMKDSFVGDYIKLVDERRRLINTFTRGTLPADGMSVDYTQLKSDTTKVAEQVNQGDDLTAGKIQLKDANAPVKTYGGYTELSLQAILRATVPTLNTTFRAMAIKYAAATEAGFKTAYQAVIDANLGTAGAFLSLGAAATADDWLDLIVDAAGTYEDNGFALSGLSVSTDVFKELLHLKDGTNRLMNVYGNGVNQVGQLDLRQLQGSIASLPVSINRGAGAGQASFYDPVALETLESPGAPAQLQNENIINLSKQFSLYGFVSFLAPFPAAIVPVQIGV